MKCQHTLMCIGTLITSLGLSLDILGVALLFFATSTRKIEAEINIGIMEHLLCETKDGEWLYQYSFEERQQEIRAARQSVERHRWLQRVALALVMPGFVPQLVSVIFL